MAPTMKKLEMNLNKTSVVEIVTEIVFNSTAETIMNQTTEVLCPPPHEKGHSRLHEFQVIKAIVLAIVTIFIMLSLCKMILQLFVQYSGKHDDG